MTDEKKPPSFGEHSKEFLESFEKATKELQEQRAELREKRKLAAEKKELAEKRLLNKETEQKALLESLKEVEEIDKDTMDNPVTESPEDARMSKYVNTLRNVDQQQRQRELAEGVELKETDLLGGADQAVTQAQLRKATGEMFARIQTSLASLGGGGLGKIEQGVQGTPADGQLPMYDAATGDMVWASVFGVGEAYADSDALVVVLDTVDSAYVNARVDGGLDSAAVINLITGTVDSDYVAARDSDLLSTAYTTADHDSDTLAQVDSAYINARVNAAGIATTDSLPEGSINLYYTSARQDSDTIILVDSAYVQARVDGGLDSAQIINLIDSAYVAARDSDTQSTYGDSDVIVLLNGDSGVQNVIPQLDSVYDLGSPSNRFKDLYLSKNTIYMGQNVSLSADGNLGDTYLYVNGDPVFPGALDSDKVIALIDSAYIAARDSDKEGNFYKTVNHDSDTLVQVDSAYIEARLPDLYGTPDHDSDTVAQVDSAYVRARQIRTLEGLDDTQIDSATIAADDFLRWNGTDWIAAPFNVDPGLSFNGSIDATVGGDSAPSVAGGSLYVNTASGVVGASYTGIAGDSIDSGQAIAYADSDNEWHILGSIAEASVVEVRQGNGISIDDSNPARPIVAINRTEVDTWYVDSARVEAMIDSEYVNLHSDHYTTANHDSDTLIQVDSAYVQARVNFDSGLDSAQAVAIIDSYVDSAFIGQHWRALENRYVPIVGPSTQTQGLYIADSFQVNTAEIWFGDQNYVGLQEVQLDSFINDGSMGTAGMGATADLEEHNGTYVVVGGGWNTDNRIAVTTDFENQTWNVITNLSSVPDDRSNFYGVGTDKNGTWVAVGYRANISYSTDDGATWQYRSSLTGTSPWSGTDYIFDVTHDGTQFIIGGEDGKMATSTDGENWAMVSTTGDNIAGIIKAVKYEPNTGRYVVGTTTGIYYTDPNGSVNGPWIQATNLGGNIAVFDAVYEPVRGIWSFFGDAGAIWRMNNPNDFTSWSIDTILGGENVRSAALNQYNHIVAVGFNGAAQVSTDAGTTWTTITTGGNTSLFGVIWDNADKRWVFGAGNRLFYKVVVEGGDGLFFNQDRLLTELDSAWVRALDLAGVDSAAIVSIIDSYVDSEFVIRHADSHFVNAAGDSMTGKLFTPAIQITGDDSGKAILSFDTGDSVHELEAVQGSDTVDMDAWIAYEAADETNEWNTVAYGNGTWVSVAKGGLNKVMYSTDGGANWTSSEAVEDRNNQWGGLTYGDGLFVAVASYAWGNIRVMYSSDGITWTAATAAANTWKSITYAEDLDLFVAVAESGTNRVMYSSDAINWTATASADESMQWHAVTYGNGVFVAVAKGGTGSRSMYSSDGINWTQVSTANDTVPWRGIAYGDGLFVAVAQSGTGADQVMTSTDGTSWTIRTAAAGTESEQWYGITYGAGKFVAVSKSGSYHAMHSEDGITWTAVERGVLPQGSRWAVAYGDNRFVTVSISDTNRVAVLEIPEAQTGLFYDGALIATETNLGPLFEKVNNLSTFTSQRMTFLDSDPTRPQGGDSYDSAQAILTSPRSGQFWYNTETSILSIRDQGVDSGDSTPRGWKSVVNPESVKAIVDSGYVQARVPAGTYVAGGRFIVNSSFTHDSSDVTPTRFVKNLFGIKDITREETGLYTLTFDSAVNTALQDSYSYIVTASIDYNADNPTASSRNVAVYDQDSNKFGLLMERADDGVNQDYGENDAGARINFTVVKAD